MSEDDDISTPEPERSVEAIQPERQQPARSRAELDAITEELWSRMQAQQSEIEQLQEKLAELENDAEDKPRLAPWLPFPAPLAAEDTQQREQTPVFTVTNFVQYYNAVYVGKSGTRAVAIPDCWPQHPGLVAELATLAYTWRAAHVGKGAEASDAQYWHDRWRTGFTERLVTEWTHQHCLTGNHKAVGATPAVDRFTVDRSEEPQAGEVPSSTTQLREHEDEVVSHAW
ncbi:hypothetical protein Amsp01_090420 [Amycolatopsis sp. NBRC 101858]|uniref:hypothetical protein n=1 Tax=Amycolatopsis sp. NBRC 101858 TaxID=3032200 RepID=UPI0024A3E66A|nr:hypothetical protein [Amycolatopsis sp. NBRC 101858]GLY43019.1 hypothetical protein Amsp01_090420 [Amycolatopsis sp. NBRC 101858]